MLQTMIIGKLKNKEELTKEFRVGQEKLNKWTALLNETKNMVFEKLGYDDFSDQIHREGRKSKIIIE